MDYSEFVKNKQLLFNPVGFDPIDKLNDKLFQFQKDIVSWALRKGRACLFEDCGLGKTPQQLEWARQVILHENKPVLIVAPLAVAQQTQQEGDKFDIPVHICESQDDIEKGINITNYEKLHKFTGNKFAGVVLDESSILKNMAGKIRNQIIDMFRGVPYRLACTATPAPNDYMELGNHAEFLGIMTYSEMLSMFFVNDSGDTGQWRLKKHANEQEFWKWLCSWVVMLSKPSDLGYIQEGFDLPELKYIEHKLPAVKRNYGLFSMEAKTMEERRRVRKETIEARCKKAAEIINQTDDQWVIWCGLNEESHLLSKLIENAKEVSGSTKYSIRAELMLDFKEGKVPRLVTKPSIAGFGMNWQNCNKMAFVGLSDSWEQLYQATRRIWRFGQSKPVEAHIIIEEREGAVLENIKRKDKQAQYMIKNMIHYTKDITRQEIGKKHSSVNYKIKREMELPQWI
jgi:superfamily II DNA or RNA helicase